MPPKSKSSSRSTKSTKKSSKQDKTEDLSPPPAEINPYIVLNIPSTATSAEIRSAYRKLALQWHPDKRQDKDAAHTKFQEIAFAYAILSDEKRKRRYDTTGSLEEAEDGDFDWKEWYTGLWDRIVSGEAIREFMENEEERGDVLQAYEDGKGSVNFIMDNIMACSYEDEPRFIEIVNNAISEGHVQKFPKWKKDLGEKAIKARRKAAEKEAMGAEELRKELGYDKPVNKMDENELGKLIRQRQQSSMDALLDKLEADARSAGKRGKRKEPTDEEFEAARARIEGRKSKKQR